MAVVVGRQGTVTSWAAPSSGLSNAAILALMTFNECEIEAPAAILDTTRFKTAVASGPAQGVRQVLSGIKNWRGTMRGMNAAPISGHTALVEVGSHAAYDYNPHEWFLNIRCMEELDTTTFQPSGGWQTFVCGRVGWDCGWTCWLDDTKPVTVPSSTASVTPLFTIGGSGTNTLTGSAYVENVRVGAAVNGRIPVTYTAQGTSDLTSAGSANIIPASSATQIFVPTELIWSPYDTTVSSSDVRFRGNAFPTRVGIRCVVNDKVTTEIDFRGTGTLTPEIA